MDPRYLVPGAARHRYRLGLPVAEDAVREFESEHAALPASYRRFILEVGTGGAGPGEGLFAFGTRDDLTFEADPQVGVPSRPTSFTRPIDGAIPVGRLFAGTDVWLAIPTGTLYGVTTDRAYVLKPERCFEEWVFDWLRRIVKAC